MRGATIGQRTIAKLIIFQSTLLVRGATLVQDSDYIKLKISIHAPRERSDYITHVKGKSEGISIHAPRERSDAKIQKSTAFPDVISIHAPRERSDNIS